MITDSDSPLLIGYDGSENAKYAIERAGALLGRRRAVVVTVWQATADLLITDWMDVPASVVNLGSVSNAVVHHAERPTRVVHVPASVATHATGQGS